MKITQVRNATLLIDYAGTRFLVDPMLAPKGSYPAFEGTANSHLRNPLVELPLPMAQLLDVDAVIVTHDHLDHWDETAPRDCLCSCSTRKMPKPFKRPASRMCASWKRS
jgi:L-ascorbate metabolism protein UlaG (beta-lactamase superfamily)